MNVRILGVATCLLAVAAVAAGPTIETVQPVVVKTVPEAGAENVPASRKEIVVTFSKDMLDESWSWVQYSAETFPKLAGKPRRLEDKRTFVLPVELEPGRLYLVGMNGPANDNFKDLGGRPAMPYTIAFRTKP